MVYTESFYQPSIFELARLGNFQAISYWINSYLGPQGIYASVQTYSAGCLQILVEFQREPAAERLVRFICHQLWKLNSPAVEGVKIVARFAGNRDILWKQSVRIVTPANRQQRRSKYRISAEWVKFKMLRTLLLMGSAIASFIIGSWVTYYEALASRPLNPNSPDSQVVLVSGPPPKRPDTVQTALETVQVVHHNQVSNPNDPTVTLMFGGDVMLSDAFEATVGKNYPWAFSELKEYREADLAMVNLDNSLTQVAPSQGEQRLSFRSDPQSVQVLTAGGIDLVNLANNHAMDYEEAGLVDTLETLKQAGIHSVGAGRNLKEARRPEIIEVKGQRIAYLSYSDADFAAAGEEAAGINPRQHERIAEDIRALRNQVDWIIINYHWGVELSDYPADWQIDLARFTIDAGADLVVGHHSHVLQGAEVYKGRPIVYSLGNFIFGGNSRSDYDTAVLKVALKGRNMRVEFLPIEVQQYQAKVVTGEKGNTILKQIERISSIFDQPMGSPTVLDARSSRPKMDTDLTQEATSKAPKLPTLPNLSTPPLETENRETENRETETKKPASFSIPSPSETPSPVIPKPDDSFQLPPKLNPPLSSDDETETDPFTKDPFIKEPFIKEPFFNIPASPASGEAPTTQSYVPEILSPSFNLSERWSQETPRMPHSITPNSNHKGIELPALFKNS